jgi:acetyl esterase
MSAPKQLRIPADLAPESRAIMQSLEQLGLLEAEGETVADLRAATLVERAVLGIAPAVGSVEEVVVDCDDGRVPVRLYRPSTSLPSRALLWIHGGGWVVGDLEQADADARRLCRDTDSLVASVEYRLAPEHPFPAGLEDVYAAARWLRAHLGDELDQFVVGGESAGGNLAAALTLLARERGEPAIDHQLLIYPVTECSFETDSYAEFAEGYGLSRDGMEIFWEYYAGDHVAARDPLASVNLAPDLAGLPPATVVVAGCDVLRDEGEAFAARLAAAEVPVELLAYPGQIHGFWSCGAVSDLPHEVNSRIRASLDRAT